MKQAACTVNATSPDVPSSVGYFVRYVERAPTERLEVEATLAGGRGGTLDVYLEQEVGPGVWSELAHLGSVPARARAETYRHTIDAAQLKSGKFRIIFVAGPGTYAGAPASIKITPFARVTLN